MPETLQMGPRQNSALTLQTQQNQSPATRVKVAPVGMGVGIQGEGYAKYFLEGLWKYLYESRKCKCDVDNLNIKLQSSRKRAATGHRFISLQKAKQSLTTSATHLS